MPVPNELTPEEEAEFANHGVAPAGAGAEPTGEPNQPEIIQQPVQRDNNGRFAAVQHERPADPAAPAAPPQAEGDPQQPAAEGDQPAPPPGFVPHAALHAERMRAQEAMRQNALLMARTNAMLQARQPEVAAPIPDLQTDPIAHINSLNERLAAFENAQRQQDEERTIDEAIRRDEANFIQYTPDYDQASDHYVKSRAAELVHFYAPAEAQQIMVNEARQMAKEAWQRGIPMAQMVYQMAQARGYQQGQAPQPQPAGQGPSGGYAGVPATPLPPTGAFAQPAMVPAGQNGQPNAQQRVQNIRQGQAATRSLSGGSGAAAPAALNAEALLNMSDDEFADYLKLGEKGADRRFANIGGG